MQISGDSQKQRLGHELWRIKQEWNNKTRGKKTAHDTTYVKNNSSYAVAWVLAANGTDTLLIS